MDKTETASKSDSLLAEVKSLRGRRQIVDVEEKTVKLVIFSLDDNMFAFYGDFIKEILQSLKVFFVPGCPDFIVGVINIRGDIESVLDIRGFLGCAPKNYGTDITLQKNNRIVIGQTDDFKSGIVVDSVVDVLDVSVHSIKASTAAISGALKDFAIGEFLYSDKNVIILDFNKIPDKL
ncbi:chemotaxis protein CheW [Candidatus Magnetomonas plexicatena]|uniref:chemotaxis protein CheW n=1 Tax=Candidatus Magnetomonas plexicatena TaxID=2552947 RepID=UPI001C7683B7|nr:chemotaxis protein CheW [Nitrospirales bacterium LBB_01]